MKIVLYLHMHQPWRLARFRYLDLGIRAPVSFDTARNLEIFRSISEKSYRPTLARLARMLEEDPDFCLSLSVTGTFVWNRPNRPHRTCWWRSNGCSLRDCVAAVAETYPHTLAFLLPPPELEEEIAMHAQMLDTTFGMKAQVLRLTELACTRRARALRGAARIPRDPGRRVGPRAGWAVTNRVYKAAGTNALPVLPRNYRLSDDIGFRFTDRAWSETRSRPASSSTGSRNRPVRSPDCSWTSRRSGNTMRHRRASSIFWGNFPMRCVATRTWAGPPSKKRPP